MVGRKCNYALNVLLNCMSFAPALTQNDIEKFGPGPSAGMA
jgi:hypothetical protein